MKSLFTLTFLLLKVNLTLRKWQVKLNYIEKG